LYTINVEIGNDVDVELVARGLRLLRSDRVRCYIILHNACEFSSQIAHETLAAVCGAFHFPACKINHRSLKMYQLEASKQLRERVPSGPYFPLCCLESSGLKRQFHSRTRRAIIKIIRGAQAK